MVNIGIFLNYDPYVKLYKEGLGRYLASQINGYVQTQNSVIIVCPKWLKSNLEKLEKDTGIDLRRVKILTPQSIPPIWKLFSFLKRERVKRRSFKDYINHKIENLAIRFASISNPAELFSFFAVLFCLFVVGLITVVPCLTMFLFRRFIKVLKKITKSKAHSIIRNIHYERLFQAMMDKSANELVDIANSQKDIDIWFVPGLFWPQVNNIDGLVVINIPDIETEVFAEGFAIKGLGEQTNRLRKTIEEGRFFITYSEYIKERLVDHQQAGQGKIVTSIWQDNHDLSKEIAIEGNIASSLGETAQETMRKFAEFNVNCLGRNRYTQFGKVGYIFFASQYRANKNMFTLLRAYDCMVHKFFRKEKLVLTCDVYSVPELRDYIISNRLENDVLVFANVSTQKLASLYCCSKLVVNPTLYEGGFPFTFGEGMSVGTPSVMSNIPQTRNIVARYGLEDILFDPYDYRDMAKKIIWGLENEKLIYEREMTLYEELRKRTPEFVAMEYISIFEKYKDIYSRTGEIYR